MRSMNICGGKSAGGAESQGLFENVYSIIISIMRDTRVVKLCENVWVGHSCSDRANQRIYTFR